MRSLPLRSSVTFPLAVALLAAQPAHGAWQTGVNYGGSLAMDLYTPTSPDESPGVVVAIHYCSGNAGAAHSWLESLANQHGFLIITPDSAGNCFDASLGRSGERAAIVQMVEYAIENHGADPERVFATGASSGACMTNALLASYPDVFAGGSVLAGVPAGFWPQGTECSICSQNPPNDSPEQWGDRVRAASNDYSGPWPRVQLWHGTADTTLNYSNLAEEVDQWTNVWGVSGGSTATAPSGWERTVYESGGVVAVEVNIGAGKPHDLTGQGLWPDVVRFFGLDQDPPEGTGGAGGTGGAETGGAETGGEGTGGDGTGGGGFAPTGGVSPTGGSMPTGGVLPTGGVPPTGGASPSGGVSTGGVTPTGGVSPSGGSMPTGGVGPTGGVSPTGGLGGTGAIAPTGGVNPTGGTATSGGASTGGSPTGGTTTSGGAGPTSGGGSSGGTAPVTGGASTNPTVAEEPGDEGCACRQGTGSGRDRPGALLALALAALGALGHRRRRA